MQKPRFLPFLAIWCLAVAVLAGLIYWGEAPRTRNKKVVKKSYSASRTGTTKPRLPAGPTAPEGRSTSVSSSSSQTDSLRPDSRDTDKSGESAPQNGYGQKGERERMLIALASPDNKSVPIPPPPSPQPPSVTPSMARVAIVIDDFGQDLEIARKFLSIPLPITFSILPHLRHSREIAELAYSRNREVILHLPMQPEGFPKTDPGRGALLLSMSAGEITQTIDAAIESCPHLAGVNNHMGSRFTADTDRMKAFLAELRGRNLYYLDSHTSHRSIGFSLAQELHIPSIRRDVFLDHIDSEDSILAQVMQLVKRARIQGNAVAIGHPHESTWKVLSRAVDLLDKEGIAVVPAGQLVADGGQVK